MIFRVFRFPFPFLVALTFAAAPATPGSAQTLPEPRTLWVAPFLQTSLGAGDPAPDDSLGVGVAVSYDWTSTLGFEGEISRLFDVAGENAAVDWPVTNFSANALYHFNTRHVTPYATLGLGMERSGYRLEGTDPVILVADFSATEVAFNFGGGVKYRLTDRWQARADLRRFQANDIAPDYWRLYAGVMFRVR